jgi:hypothetical protein
MIPRIFDGQPVVIVAGGASLIGFDFTRLAGLNVIAVNRAGEFIPGATVLWWTDAKFWHHNSIKILGHPAPYKATCTINYSGVDLPHDIHRYRFTGHKGFDPDPGCLRSGNNSTYAAIHLAAHLGARRIILLGVDMRLGPNGESHFHGGHGLVLRAETLTELMLPWFDHLKAPLAERGIEVLNASADSALHTWPRCTIDQGLAEYEKASSRFGRDRGCGLEEKAQGRAV